jgi:tRNA nucleotidyltransferase/poly(A) polymerase
MRDTEVLDVILPEIAVLKNFEHDPKFHPEGDVLPHVIAAVRACDSTDPQILWAAALHDVGKSATFALREKNSVVKKTYYGHDAAGVGIIEQIATRLKLPTRTKEIAQFCAKNHMLCHRLHEMKPIKVLKLMEHKWFDILMQVANCDVLCRGDSTATEEIVRRNEFNARFKKKYEATRLITGAFVMNVAGIPEGPRVGELIEKMKTYVVETGETDIAVIESKLKKFVGVK